MRRWKLRTQVALAAAAAIFLAVVVLGAAVQLLLARQLHSQLDATLQRPGRPTWPHSTPRRRGC